MLSRKRKFAFNMTSALFKQIVTIVCSFILPRYILSYYGSSVNGLISSITQFLGIISFLEMGVGPVIQSNLYKPLAEKNNEEISKIVVSAEKFFRKIAFIFILYIIILIIIFPLAINNKFDFIFTGSLILIISISQFSQYYFGITYQLLLNADQKSYVQITLQTVTILLNTIISVFLITLGLSVQIVKISTAIIYVLRPIGQMLYIKKRYNINKKIKFYCEPINQKWNGFAQHLASVVVTSTDITVLSICSTMQNVSVYSVYYNVVGGINNAIMTFVTGLEALWGSMIANHETQRLIETFDIIEWLVHVGSTFIFTVTGILIVPFIRVYTNGVSDANYIVPLFGATLVMAYGIQCLRIPYFRIIKAAGHYKETQNGSFIQMTINIILSITLVYRHGIYGVAVGTLVAMFYHTTYFAWYLRKNILTRKFSHYLKHICMDAVVVLTSVFVTKHISLTNISYLDWTIMAIKVVFVCFLVSVVINLVAYRTMIKTTIKMMGTK